MTGRTAVLAALALAGALMADPAYLMTGGAGQLPGALVDDPSGPCGPLIARPLVGGTRYPYARYDVFLDGRFAITSNSSRRMSS